MKMISAIPGQAAKPDSKPMSFNTNVQDLTNKMGIQMKQIKEKKSHANFQERLQEATENYEFFHRLCIRMANEIALYRKQLGVDNFGAK